MKRIILLLMFAFMLSGVSAQSTYYRADKKVKPHYVRQKTKKNLKPKSETTSKQSVFLPANRSKKGLEKLQKRYDTPLVTKYSVCEDFYNVGKRYNNISFIDLNYACSTDPQHSFGVTLGHVEQIGFYISAMTGIRYVALNTDVECDQSGYVGDEMQYYSGTTATSRYSIICGAMLRLSDPLAFKIGVGYGERALAWETGDGRWIRNTYYSYSGFEINAGMQFFFNMFNMSFDVITNGQSMAEFKIGLGININR